VLTQTSEVNAPFVHSGVTMTAAFRRPFRVDSSLPDNG
jgi:hypothetical protein